MNITLQNFVSITGLMINIIGVWFISRGIMKKITKALRAEASFSYGVTDTYVINGYLQKIECNVGFVLVLLGSLMQISTQFYNAFDLLKINTIVILFVGIIIFFLLLLLILNICIKRRHRSYIRKYFYDHYYKEDMTLEKKHIDDLKRHIRYIHSKYDNEKKN